MQALCVRGSVGNAAWQIHVHAEQMNGEGQWGCPGAQSGSCAERWAQSFCCNHSKTLLRFLWAEQEYVNPL